MECRTSPSLRSRPPALIVVSILVIEPERNLTKLMGEEYYSIIRLESYWKSSFMLKGYLPMVARMDLCHV